MMIAYLLANDMWYGWTFVFCIIILIVNALLLTRAKFAPQPRVKTESGEKIKGFVGVSKASKFAVEGIALIVIGCTCTATFQIFLAVMFVMEYYLLVAVELIDDGDTLAVCGAGGGIVDPLLLIEALKDRYLETKEPKNLTLWHFSGLGDRGDRGMSPLSQKGMVKRATGGHWGQSPRLAEMAERNEIEAYNFPQGVMAQLVRSAAAGHPGILFHVGLGTFADSHLKEKRFKAINLHLLELYYIIKENIVGKIIGKYWSGGVYTRL